MASNNMGRLSINDIERLVKEANSKEMMKYLKRKLKPIME